MANSRARAHASPSAVPSAPATHAHAKHETYSEPMPTFPRECVATKGQGIEVLRLVDDADRRNVGTCTVHMMIWLFIWSIMLHFAHGALRIGLEEGRSKSAEASRFFC